MQLPSKAERLRIGWALIPGRECEAGTALVLWQLTFMSDRLSQLFFCSFDLPAAVLL